jgi:branched-chain amino acid transport system ATP-binding protein
MARAVMLNPEVVLLDEPSMGLAPILVDEVFRIIQRLKEQGVRCCWSSSLPRRR